MADLEEQIHLYYQSIYQQGYSDGHTSRRYQNQYKPIDISQMFAPNYHPTSKKPSPSSCTERDVLEIHAHIFEPQINEIPQKPTLKKCPYQCGMKLVNGCDASYAQCQIYCSPERTKPNFSTAGLSATASLHCDISPMVHPIGLHVDNLPSKTQWAPQMPALEEQVSSHNSSPQAPHFSKKGQLEEARRC